MDRMDHEQDERGETKIAGLIGLYLDEPDLNRSCGIEKKYF
jgi:hypothetical protein